MRILAIDMGRSKSVACDYVAETAEHRFETVVTDPAVFHDLILRHDPDVVVIEISPAAGWVRDLCEVMGKRLAVANTADEAWRWRKIKTKTDCKDAVKQEGDRGGGPAPADKALGDVARWNHLA